MKILTPGQEDVVSGITHGSRQEMTINMLEVVGLAYKQAADWGTHAKLYLLLPHRLTTKQSVLQ